MHVKITSNPTKQLNIVNVSDTDQGFETNS